MSEKRNPDIAGGSDIGKKRKENQDHFLIADLRRELHVIETDIDLNACSHLYGSQPGRLMVIADGMGGHADGERASGTAVQAAARYVLDMTHWFLKLSRETEDDFKEELENAMSVVQESIFDANGPAGREMGTTVTMAYVVWPRMYVIHAGDSRCYLLRDGELTQMTTDHTYAQKLLDEKTLTAEEAATSNWRHVLWNCVGGSNERVDTEVTKITLRPSDAILLCSDGLSGMISDETIKQTVAAANGSRDAVDRLIRSANEASGADNISVIVAQYSDDEPDSGDEPFDLSNENDGQSLADTVIE